MSIRAEEIYLNSYNYRGYPFARALYKAREFGYDGVELWAGHYQVDTVEETLREAQRLGRLLHIGVPVLNLSGNVIDDDLAERAGRVRRLREIVERCPDLGVSIVNGYAGSLIVDRADWGKNGSAAATAEHYARAVEAYYELGGAAQRAGVVLTLEIHMNTIHDTAASAVRLLDAIGSPAVRANFDAGNMYGTRTAEPVLDAIRLLGERIAFAHVKNARGDAARTPAGIDYHWDLAHGDLDYFAIVSALAEAGFHGPYGIEYSGAGDRSVPSRDDLRYLRGLFAEVGLTRTQQRSAAEESRTASARSEGRGPAHQEPL
jgi:sugar phosphate isomerase/epimerase